MPGRMVPSGGGRNDSGLGPVLRNLLAGRGTRRGSENKEAVAEAPRQVQSALGHLDSGASGKPCWQGSFLPTPG